MSTLVAGVCGGVAQTTPYIGQPAYKHMGARSGYTLLTGLFIGLGGILGYVSGLVQWLPLAVLAPIIVYVGLDITVQAFHETPRRHAIAVSLGFLPSIAYLLNIKFGNPMWMQPEVFAGLYNSTDTHGLSDMAAIVTLGNGFIITAMIWVTALVAMIDGQMRRAVLALLAIALDARAIDARLGQIAISAILLAMVAGAVVIRFNSAIAGLLARSAGPAQAAPGAPQAELPLPGAADASAPVVIGGYGRVGHTVAVLLQASGVPFVAFDTDPNRVAQGRADGHAVGYGDIADPELLAAIHVERAALVILTVDEAATALQAVTLLRKACPQVPVIARARTLDESSELIEAGAAEAHPEAIEASLRLGATALQMLRVAPEDIEQIVQGVRDWDYRPVAEAPPDR